MNRALLVLWVGLSGVPAIAGVPVAESYELHCSGCHRLDGSGVPGVVPSLRKIGPLVQLEGGRAYLASVPGVAQAPLPSDELAALLNYVLAELARAEGFDAFTAEEIEAGRATPLRDPLAVRPGTPRP